MPRHKDANWDVPQAVSTDQAQLTVLMDIRDELKKLNNLLHCHNFTSMPHVLRRIDRRLQKKIKLSGD